MPPTSPAFLVRWDGVLVVATVGLLATVGGWLLLHMMRCFRRGCSVRVSWRGERKQQLPTPLSPQRTSALEWLATSLLRHAGPVCALVLVLVLIPTALQLRHALQQDEIVDTESVHTPLEQDDATGRLSSDASPPPPLPSQSRPFARLPGRTQIDRTPSGYCCWIPTPLCSTTSRPSAPRRASACAARRVSLVEPPGPKAMQ